MLSPDSKIYFTFRTLIATVQMSPEDNDTTGEDSNRRRLERAFEIDLDGSTRDVATENLRRTIEAIGEERFEAFDANFDLEDFV